jgi:hypothetical protein
VAPEPAGILRSLIGRLTRAFPETPPYGGQFGSDPIPHLTIALGESEEELQRLQAEILARLQPRFPLRVSVHALSLDEEGPDGAWRAKATIELRDA